MIEAGVATPVLLWLFAQPGIGAPERDRALTALESYLVRRTACRLTTKDYNRLFIELVARLHQDPTLADDPVVGYLAAQDADAREWPDDRQLQAAFIELPLYRLLTRGRLRMLLEAVEESLRGPYAETQQVPKQLTIEHVMPRAWRTHWAPPDGDDQSDAAAHRDRLVHSIGNLTLLNSKLNTAQSNGPWDTKQVALDAHSVLYLNKRLMDDHRGKEWNEAGIRTRSRDLAELAGTVWPSAADMNIARKES